MAPVLISAAEGDPFLGPPRYDEEDAATPGGESSGDDEEEGGETGETEAAADAAALAELELLKARQAKLEAELARSPERTRKRQTTPRADAPGEAEVPPLDMQLEAIEEPEPVQLAGRFAEVFDGVGPREGPGLLDIKQEESSLPSTPGHSFGVVDARFGCHFLPKEFALEPRRLKPPAHPLLVTKG